MKFSPKPKNLPLLVSMCGVLGMLLRIWTLGKGPDKVGLYEPQPLAWVLLWVVTALTLGLIFALIFRLKTPGKYADHFPSSLPGAVGCAAAALAMAISAFRAVGEPAFLYAIGMTAVGLSATVGMGFAAVSRYKGAKNVFWGMFLGCAFQALRVFDCCRGWSNEPQLTAFLPEFLASLSLMLAFFYLTGFAADLPHRRRSLFWSFAAAFFCIVALPGSHDGVFYACMALFLLTNHCTLRPIHRITAPVEETDTKE